MDFLENIELEHGYSSVPKKYEFQLKCEELLNSLVGIDASFSVPISDYFSGVNITDEQARALEERYGAEYYKYVDGKELINNPLVGWSPSNENDPRIVLIEAGHELGTKGELGKYFFLMADSDFSKGYWMGKMENAVSVSDMNTLEDVKREMQLLRPNTYQEEFSQMMGSLFTVVTDNGYETPKGLK